jgi:hypothetical protein
MWPPKWKVTDVLFLSDVSLGFSFYNFLCLRTNENLRKLIKNCWSSSQCLSHLTVWAVMSPGLQELPFSLHFSQGSTSFRVRSEVESCISPISCAPTLCVLVKLPSSSHQHTWESLSNWTTRVKYDIILKSTNFFFLVVLLEFELGFPAYESGAILLESYLQSFLFL